MKIQIHTEYIKLEALLKYAGLVETGGQAKQAILAGQASVNGQTETARGKKIRSGDTVSFQGTELEIV